MFASTDIRLRKQKKKATSNVHRLAKAVHKVTKTVSKVNSKVLKVTDTVSKVTCPIPRVSDSVLAVGENEDVKQGVFGCKKGKNTSFNNIVV